MFKQIIAVTGMNLRSLPQRLGASMVIVIGIAVTVAVLVSVQAMALGFQKTLGHTGRPDRAIVLRGGSEAELNSTISRENTLTIMDAPGIRKDADGKPLATAEAVAIIALPQKSNDSPANVTVRGIGPKAMAVRPEIHLVAGRMFQPAVREVIVGTSAQAQFKGLELNSHIAFRDSDWTVVGVFDSGGDAHQSELVGDAETVLSAFRHNLFHSVTVLLDSPAAFDQFKDTLTTDPTLTVEVLREPEYYAKQSAQLSTILNIVAYFVGGIAAIGAMVGALNTMYTAVSSRAREIATLRAIGFNGASVATSVIAEALLLAALGALIGGVLAWIFFNGNTVNTLGKNFSQVVFQLSVGPELLVQGFVMALMVGFLGSLAPSLQLAGPFLWRYAVLLVVLAVFESYCVRLLVLVANDGPARPAALAGSGLLLVALVVIGLGYLSLRAIVRARARGGLQGVMPRLLISVAVVLLTFWLLPLCLPLIAYHFRALWTRTPNELVTDSVVEGLRGS